MTFLNWKGPAGRETVDQLDRKEFESFKAYQAEFRRLCAEYRLAGMDVYASSRCCANWKEGN